MAEDLNQRLYETLQQTAINAFGPVPQRVAAHLLDLASAQLHPRVLRDFRVAGIMATSSDGVLILDAAAAQPILGPSWPVTLVTERRH